MYIDWLSDDNNLDGHLHEISLWSVFLKIVLESASL